MEEEAVHPLDQLIAAAKKADTEKAEPVFTVDEKGRMTENRGKQESTATTRKRNTDVVFKATSTMPSPPAMPRTPSSPTTAPSCASRPMARKPISSPPASAPQTASALIPTAPSSSPTRKATGIPKTVSTG